MVKRPTHGRSHTFQHGGSNDDDDEPESQQPPEHQAPVESGQGGPGPLSTQGIGVDPSGAIWWYGPNGYEKVGQVPQPEPPPAGEARHDDD